MLAPSRAVWCARMTLLHAAVKCATDRGRARRVGEQGVGYCECAVDRGGECGQCILLTSTAVTSHPPDAANRAQLITIEAARPNLPGKRTTQWAEAGFV